MIRMIKFKGGQLPKWWEGHRQHWSLHKERRRWVGLSIWGTYSWIEKLDNGHTTFTKMLILIIVINLSDHNHHDDGDDEIVWSIQLNHNFLIIITMIMVFLPRYWSHWSPKSSSSSFSLNQLIWVIIIIIMMMMVFLPRQLIWVIIIMTMIFNGFRTEILITSPANQLLCSHCWVRCYYSN